jgi:hypothetical protein
MKTLFIFIISIILFYGCATQKPYSIPTTSSYVPKDFDDAERWFDSIHNYHKVSSTISTSL